MSSGDTVLPSQHNPAMQDLGQSVGNSLSRDGLGGMRADLNMGGYSITNANNLSIGGTLSIGGSSFNPVQYAKLSGAVFSGGVEAESGIIVAGYSVVEAAGDGFAHFEFRNAASSYVAEIRCNATGVVDVRGDRLNVNGLRVPVATRERTYISDGTGSPSGGLDGDLYFQYTP